ncbi:uncharacterized protein LOC123305712 [Chrysoperla carnea]|uniref:uncharacterized protein LOC123305712 n=1 Tax=Chrysoperla carnea TaxID=189513 RepID=UPI001D0937AA|nr:uncharacterized protein LOC123305712 [Chrysoperla carnea]
MKFIVHILAFVCLAQSVFGAPSQASNAEPSNLDGLSELINNFSSGLLESAKKIGEEGANNMKSGFNELAGHMNKIMSESDLKKAMQNFQETMNGHMEALKKENPEAAASAQKMQESFKEAFDKALEEGKKMTENSKGVMEDMSKVAKEAFEKGMAAAKEAHKKLEKQMEKKP